MPSRQDEGTRVSPDVEALLRDMYAYVRACSTAPVAAMFRERLARIGIGV